MLFLRLQQMKKADPKDKYFRWQPNERISRISFSKYYSGVLFFFV